MCNTCIPQLKYSISVTCTHKLPAFWEGVKCTVAKLNSGQTLEDSMMIRPSANSLSKYKHRNSSDNLWRSRLITTTAVSLFASRSLIFLDSKDSSLILALASAKSKEIEKIYSL